MRVSQTVEFFLSDDYIGEMPTHATERVIAARLDSDPRFKEFKQALQDFCYDYWRDVNYPGGKAVV